MRLRKLLKSGLFLLFVAPLIAAQESLPDLVSRIKPSVVALVTYDEKGHELARGSGFFTAPDRVVTNLHVIESASRVEIHQSDGTSVPVRGILAVDGEGDLVLLRVQLLRPPKALALAPFLPREGQSVVVIGNPMGLEGSVSNGIVSAVREVASFGRLIQITAAISPGSSGSPVIDMKGNVVGIASLQLRKGQSLNFAVPAERIARLQPGDLVTFSERTNADKSSHRAKAQRSYNTGIGYLGRDEYAQALPYFIEAVVVDPDYPEAWFQIGYCDTELGRYAQAVDAFKRAVKIKPNFAEAYSNMGNAYSYLDRYQAAIESYRQALRIDPSDAITYKNMGGAYHQLERFEDAIRWYKEAIRLRPDDADTYANLGLSLGRLHEWEEAIQAHKQAIRINPDHAQAHYLLGLAYFATGRTSLALDEYKVLKSVDPAKAQELFQVIRR